jgi:nucleoside-diphosphate-sugar epimerase
MRVAVTGAMGFLGRAACAAFIASGHEVLALDRAGAAPAGCKPVHADIADRTAVLGALQVFRPDALVHLAALLTPESAADCVEATRVNALGTAVTFDAALRCGVQRIVYASSVAALGPAAGAPGDDAPPRPASVYGATKAMAEHLAAALACGRPDATFIGLRFGWVVGPGRDRGWRPLLDVIEAAARGEPTVRYPDYPGPLDWTWIGDAAAVIVRAVTRPVQPGHHVLNVAGDKRPVADAIAHLRRHCPATRFTPVAATTPPAAWGFRSDGLAALLDIVPATPLETMIDRCLSDLAGQRPAARTGRPCRTS